MVILLQEGTRLRVWERMELKGFDREGPILEGDFAENELMKLFQSGGVAVLDLIKNIRNEWETE